MGRVFGRPTKYARECRPAFLRLAGAVAERSGIFTGLHPGQLQVVPALLRLCAYAARWQRPPEDWQPPAGCSAPRRQWNHLLHHLLARWPLPRFFASAWETFGDLLHVERDWYCHAAEGGSMRQAPGMPVSVTGRALHLMTQAPDHLTVRQALRWGQATAAGCRETLRQEITGSRMASDLSHDFIWWRLMQKAAALDLRQGDWSLLTDGMLLSIRRDGYRQAARLLDIPVPMLLRHCRTLFHSLLEAYRADGLGYRVEHLSHPGLRAELCDMAVAVWPPLLPGDPAQAWTDAPDGHWICRELTSLSQLVAEGQRMRHCVATYRTSCQSGRTAIFSLRRARPGTPQNEYPRVLTIEVERSTRCIVQVKGRWNRRADEEERAILSRWADAHGLQWA
jgi:hypothetical protein